MFAGFSFHLFIFSKSCVWLSCVARRFEWEKEQQHRFVYLHILSGYFCGVEIKEL
jgi:hypothetical protein